MTTGKENTRKIDPKRLEEALRQEIDAEADAIAGAARKEAAQIVGTARARARRRFHQAAELMRQNRSQALQRAEALAARAAREQRQAETARLLVTGMAELEKVLRAGWQDPETRRAWWRGAGEQAMRLLLAGPGWKVEHPEGWPGEERGELASLLETASGDTPVFAVSPGLGAGLRILTEEACLDATVEGLLAERTRIEAELLVRIEARLAPVRDGEAPQ
jgi:hypothetical protein